MQRFHASIILPKNRIGASSRGRVSQDGIAIAQDRTTTEWTGTDEAKGEERTDDE